MTVLQTRGAATRWQGFNDLVRGQMQVPNLVAPIGRLARTVEDGLYSDCRVMWIAGGFRVSFRRVQLYARADNLEGRGAFFYTGLPQVTQEG